MRSPGRALRAAVSSIACRSARKIPVVLTWAIATARAEGLRPRESLPPRTISLYSARSWDTPPDVTEM
jgi:hypothetical protein